MNYRLEVPATAPSTLEGGAARYACCHQTDASGHAPHCTEERRCEVIEAALRRSGIAFERETDAECGDEPYICGKQGEGCLGNGTESEGLLITHEGMHTPTYYCAVCMEGVEAPADTVSVVDLPTMGVAEEPELSTVKISPSESPVRIASAASVSAQARDAATKLGLPAGEVEGLAETARLAASADVAEREVKLLRMILGNLNIVVHPAERGRVYVARDGHRVGYYTLPHGLIGDPVWQPLVFAKPTVEEAVQVRPLDFLDRLRELNVRRCEAHYHPIDAFNLLEWAGAMAGEAGEAANLAKKIHCAQAGMVPDSQRTTKTVIDLGREVADTLIYGDLLCARAHLSLLEMVRRAFNERSVELGFTEVL